MGGIILLVEDSPDDVFFLQRAFKRAEIKAPLQVVKDGQQALGYLGGVGEYADRQKYPLPCLVLLDLKLPYVPGFDVLKWIRSRTELQTLPVIILTSSSERSDLDRAYRLGANSFLVKPSDSGELLGLAKCFADYWLKYNLLPPIG
jgi:DNA-binding response OmpR family regulator